MSVRAAPSAREAPALDAVARIVIAAADSMPALDRGGIAVQRKADGSLVTAVDRELQAQLHAALADAWPGYGFVGEEMPHAEQVAVLAAHPGGCWILDPLDGTTNFTCGFSFYGISLALVADGAPVLAVVYDPVRRECFSARAGGGAFLNGTPLAGHPAERLADCVANVDHKRLVGELAAQLVRCPPFRSQRNLGASVLEWSWLAAGRIQLYLHGGQKLWDFAAGWLILAEAGGAATSLSGEPLGCASLRKRSVVAAANPVLLRHWVEWIDANSDLAHPGPWQRAGRS